MSKYLKVIIVLILPLLIAFAVLFASQKGFDSKLRTGLYEAYKNEVTQKDLKKITSFKFCAAKEGREMAPEFCRDILLISAAEVTAAAGIILSVIYIAIITRLGARARRNRELLLKYFKPALFMTAGLSIFFLLITTVTLLAAVFYGEVALANRYHPKIMLVLALVGLVGVYIVIKAVLQALKRPLQNAVAVLLTKEENPEIWAMAEDVAYNMGSRAPDNIIAGIDPTFYATEVDNKIQNTPLLAGETLYLSIPLCRILSRGELRSIIGHELAHFAGDDVKYTISFYPIYTGAANAVEMFYRESAGNALSFIGLLGVTTMFTFFLKIFSEAEREIGRERELNADKQSASKASTPQENASALVKVYAYAPAFDEAYDKMAQSVQEQKPLENLGTVFMDCIKQLAPEKAYENLELKGISHPTDTHPLLSQRLENLGIKAGDIAQSAMKIDYHDAAVRLIPKYEEIEKQLTAVMNENYVQYLKAVEETQKQGKKK
jgi:Zn-dependent protease with chaperone function